jgi:hypothetical protein
MTINAQGTEASECNQGFERALSSAALTGRVFAPDDQTLDVTLNGTISGGHYATGTCAFGNIIGKVGHDNGVSLVGNFNGDIRTVVRSDEARELAIRLSGLPAGASIEVKDSNGVVITGSSPEPQATGEAVFRFPLKGAGIYMVTARWTLPGSVNGASTQQVSYHSMIKAEVH